MPRTAPRAALGAALALLALAAPAAASSQTHCDPFGARACLMPFPNDMNLTVRDSASPTGLRVRLPRAALPANKDGVRPDPAEWNRADGFSPNQPIVVRVPGLDSPRALRRSGLTPVTDLGRSRARRASLVILDARTRRRQLAWAEVDVAASRRGQRMLLIHVAKNLVFGRRYVVVLRGLRTASGRRIRAPRSFRAILRGGGPRRYRARYRGIFRTLRRAGISRRGLYLAWDFTVASQHSIQGRMVAMRDDAFAQLGDRDLADGRVAGRPPEFSVEDVRAVTDDPRVARRVSGTFTVPCYLDRPGCPVGSRFAYRSGAPSAVPGQQPGNVQQARFECTIPAKALTAPARISYYGHGLLGGPEQVDEDNIRAMSEEHDIVFCATAWYGFARDDVPQAIRALQDYGQFAPIADRSQQGFLAQLYLGRLMLHPQGLASHPAFQNGGQPLIDTGELFYDGNSQGGILGGALVAMAPDFRRAVLGVPGMTFSTLLYRSSNWDLYSRVFYPAIPDEGDRQLVLSLIQMLWDRGEPNGWAANATTDPPPNTPQHTVLLHPVVGDWQVSNWQADAMARTMGASARRPAIAAGRTLERRQLYGIPGIRSFPFTGSAIVYWDPGADFTGITPAENVWPRTGHDSHYAARTYDVARRQKSEFLRPGGAVVEVCTPGQPCGGADDDTP
ncbi:MAG TPA: hypothetical protein VGW75_01835 [Solirubrobacteraceae bacterium]|nr:hypothetical protein [Solirubrobacteraceae bacterium]